MNAQDQIYPEETKIGDLTEKDQDNPSNDSIENQAKEERKMPLISKRDYFKYKNKRNRSSISLAHGSNFELEDKHDLIEASALQNLLFSHNDSDVR